MTSNQEPTTLAEFGGHEIYPMPMFATLAVADVAAVAAWYERALGFATVFRAPDAGGQPALVHLRRRNGREEPTRLAARPWPARSTRRGTRAICASPIPQGTG